jgi:hypothetical protein
MCPILVPFAGGVEALGKRNRTFPAQEAALADIPIPSVYIFNVGPRPWKGVGGGREWTIPACPKGQRYSEPVRISMICLSEIDLADGGNNMGTNLDSALSGTTKVGDEERYKPGVADDIIGVNSTTAGLDLNTTNGAWFGVFASQHEVPLIEEVQEAHEKLRQMMQLIYSQGASIVEQKIPENAVGSLRMKERKLYNEAATYLGYKPLWGDGDAALVRCPECQEPIQEGANTCKHCHQAIDPASVAARAKKREREAAKLLKDDGDEDKN